MIINLHLNARLLPIHRFYTEDILNKAMEADNIGEVTGGGTFQDSNGEVKSCDIEITLFKKDNFNKLKEIIIEMNFPNGSYLESNDKKIEVGLFEGLAIYLNGTDLSKETYKNCDVNYVIKELETLMGEDGKMYSYFEGQNETSLYFYGKSFESMHRDIKNFTNEYPLCKKCRIEKIS